MTRINRILIHALLGMEKRQLNTFNDNGGPQYIRVLGFNEKGRELLKLIKKNSPLPIISNIGDISKYPEPTRSMLEIEAKATDLYVLGFKNPEEKRAGRDQTASPIII